MQRMPIAVLGASGYSGIESTRILAHHPWAELRVVVSDRWQGEPVERHTGLRGPAGRLKYAPAGSAVELARECAAALLCFPVEASLEAAPRLAAAGVKVIDFSGAFRLRDASVFQAAYKLAHPHPELLAQAVYGLPELTERTAIAGASLIANPGCYPTAAALALAPLYEAGLLGGEEPIVDAASGTTGAGRKASEEMSFTEVMDDFHAYRVLKHQHTPEIAQSLERAAGRAVGLTFTAHLLPVRRGILATSYARLRSGVSAAQVRDAYLHKYADEPFVQLAASPEEVGLKKVVGTNLCQIGFAVEGTRLVVLSAIDNLVKGAAGQAVQNLNLALGWPETAGLDTLRGFHP